MPSAHARKRAEAANLAKRLAKRVKTRPGELQQSQAGCKTRLPLGQALNMDS
ncbi:MAG: hypothetical protein ACPHL9_01690 [Limisphaerales bacterium]